MGSRCRIDGEKKGVLSKMGFVSGEVERGFGGMRLWTGTSLKLVKSGVHVSSG